MPERWHLFGKRAGIARIIARRRPPGGWRETPRFSKTAYANLIGLPNDASGDGAGNNCFMGGNSIMNLRTPH